MSDENSPNAGAGPGLIRENSTPFGNFPSVFRAKGLFSTFTGDAVAQEKLSTYESTDALNFKLIPDTGFSGPSGALRDPSIMKFEDRARPVARRVEWAGGDGYRTQL